PPMTAADKWTVAGQSIPKANGRAYVTGQHEYASDIRRPGMLFGKILRPPSLKAKLLTVNTKAAEAMPGVKVVQSGDFIGVVAATAFAADAAVSAIKAEWQPVPQVSGKELFKHLKEKAGAGGGRGGGRAGGGAPADPA